MPFKGTITSVNVKSGQRVEAGEILARYRLAPDATVQIQQRLNPPRLKELESKLAEVEKSMVSLEVKQRELNQLSQQKLAAPMSKTQTDREVQQLAKQKRAVQENLAQEKQLALEDQAFLKSQLGTAAKPGQVPREATIIAPISGFIIWVHPDLREGGELDPMRAVFQVGVMDPMVIRAQVYELEALQLNLGGAAEVTVESLPGRNFEAQLSRISWAPVPPPVWVPAGQEHPSYYEVELTVPNPDLVLKEGLKGRITLRRPR
jgi:multidrug resistance efflux pump